MTTIVRKNNYLFTDSKTKTAINEDVFRVDLGPKFFILPEKSIAVAVTGVINKEKVLTAILNLARQLIDRYAINEDMKDLLNFSSELSQEEDFIKHAEVVGMGSILFFLKDFTLVLSTRESSVRREEFEKNKANNSDEPYSPLISIYQPEELCHEGSCISSYNVNYFVYHSYRTDDLSKLTELVSFLIEGDNLSGGTLNIFDLNNLLPYQPMNLGEKS